MIPEKDLERLQRLIGFLDENDMQISAGPDCVVRVILTGDDERGVWRSNVYTTIRYIDGCTRAFRTEVPFILPEALKSTRVSK